MMKPWAYHLLTSFGAMQNTQPAPPSPIVQDVAPPYLYKIISLDQWKQSQGHELLDLLPMDESFIHLAKEDQVHAIAQKFWADKPYLVLKLKTDHLPGTLIYEKNPGGSTSYYHLYNGSIPMDAIVETISPS